MAPIPIKMLGRTFGYLTVMSRHPNRGTMRYWECKCVCGKTISVVGHSLRALECRSCGCMNGMGPAKVNVLQVAKTVAIRAEKDRARKEAREADLLGQTYGSLTVVAATSDWHGQPHWECQCLCGDRTIVSAIHLLNDLARSCGCVARRAFDARLGWV